MGREGGLKRKTIKKWSSRQRRRPDEQSPRADYGLDLGDKVDIVAVVKLQNSGLVT